jgi:hypothetical protein
MTRNDKILIAVLRGYTLKQVGIVFQISRERVRQIVSKTVRKYDRDIHYSVVIMDHQTRNKIKEFRKHKNRLISIITNRSSGQEGCGG